MIDTKVFSSEALPDYYSRLAQRLKDCSCFRIALAKKAEAGSARSEKGYQMLAVSTARGIAEALGYDANKAATVSLCVGIGFPRGGKEGMATVTEYALAHGAAIDPKTLGAEAAMHMLCKWMPVATDLTHALDAYCSNSPTEAIACPEVRSVRICQEMLERVKRAEYFLGADGGKLLYDSSEETIAASRQAGVPTLGATLLEMTKELPEIPPRMTAEERAEILAGVDEFVRYYAFPEGLYRYVRSDGGDTKGEPQ